MADSKRRKKTPRFMEIAQLAGVSPSTVDRVLNERGSVSANAREKVVSAAKQLGVPRVLPQTRHGLIHIDVLLPANHTPFFRRMNVALQRSIGVLDKRVVVHRAFLPEHKNDVIAQAILNPPYRRRGLILASPDTEPVRQALRTISTRGETAVAVVTNIGKGDHLGLSYISTVEDLSVVKRVIVQNVKPDTGYAVLNAADPMVVRMADACPGKVIFFARDRNHPVMAMHRTQGKRIIYLDGDSIVACEGSFTHRIPLAKIPVTANGAIGFQIENAMASAGAGWALGLDWELIHAGLADFVNDAQSAPGRFNLFNYRGATLIADYGHNPDAIQALVNAIDNMPNSPACKRSVVISGAGDRRDEDIRQQTEILGDAFDQVVLYQDQCQRGRADGDT